MGLADKLIVDFRDYNKARHEIIQYPAGELQVRIHPGWIETFEAAKEIVIHAQLTDEEGGLNASIIGLLMLNDAIVAVNPAAKRILYLPYLPYARADRRFVPGDCHGLATFGEILRVAHFDETRTLDVHHASRSFMWIPRLRNIQPDELINRALDEFAFGKYGVTVLFPDEGAAKRYGNMRREGVQFLCATKKRDATTGELLGFDVPDTTQFKFDRIMIVDDICDGGGTFVGVAEALRAKGNSMQLGLYVTHGIFSNGFSKLREYFDEIYTTDSVWREGSRQRGFTVYDAYAALDSNDVSPEKSTRAV